MVMEDVTSGRVTETVQVGPLDADIPPMPGSTSAGNPQRTLPSMAQLMTQAPAGSWAWWARRLMAKMNDGTARRLQWEAYYDGDQPLQFATERFREAFGGRFRAFSSNFMALVVDGTRERIEVNGFTFRSSRSTRRAMDIWKVNALGARSQVAHTEALIKSVAYTLVQPGGPGRLPRVTVEDGLHAITEDDAAGKPVAGLKWWLDDYGRLVVYVYLPDHIWKVRTNGAWTHDAPTDWEPAPAADEPWPLPNRLGVVPLTPLYNRPRLHGRAQSEIDQVMSNQDAVNKYRADALVAAEFAAFRQRWATGLEIPRDPETGRPVEPFKAAIDRLWIVPPRDPDDPPDMPEPKFGEFSATDLAPYQLMIQGEVGAISTISRLPYHYLLGQPESVPPSGESLKSSEAGLIRKVKTQMLHFGEAWERTMRLALLAAGDRAGANDLTAQVLWADPETRNEGARTDATVKAYTAGIIDRNEARQALGYELATAQDDTIISPPPA